MKQALRIAALLLLQALLVWTSPARAAPNHIAAQLVAESTAAPGGTVMLAFAMRPESGWHGYWLNPGDAGLGMTLNWRLPGGAKVGAPRYPVPDTLLISGLMNHVYNTDYAVLVPFTAPPDAKPGARLPLSVKADWLACTEQVCVPESAVLETEVVIGAPGLRDPRFDGWERALPAPLGTKAAFTVTAQTIRIGVPLPASVAVTLPHFFISDDRLIAYAQRQTYRRDGDLLTIELPRAKIAPLTPQKVSGVLRLNGEGDGLWIEATPGDVPEGGVPLADPQAVSTPLPLLLLGALLGGLLLNVMPCVFPILSIKALSLTRAGGSKTHARAEGLAYSAGVITACLALGALLLGLRAAGQEVGWAFQLQEPAVVAALLLLTVTITANLMGSFEFAVPGFARSGSSSGAFATGLLAAFVATPCTGPFMAAAMGAALLLPTVQGLALFAALGLGIALPFLAIAYIPALRRLLPQPGAWMERFRRWMALPMALTALALVWLASRLGGTAFAAVLVVVAILLTALLFRIGQRQRGGHSAQRAALAAVAIALLGVPVAARLVQDQAATADAGLLNARPFSEAALTKARASGKPVFVWLTADWCLTCKVNEQVAIERETTRDAFAKAGVVVLRGDWTRRDPAITRYLTSQGAAGVPLYVWYPADGGGPRQQPQILTSAALAQLVQNN